MMDNNRLKLLIEMSETVEEANGYSDDYYGALFHIIHIKVLKGWIL